MRVLTYVLCGLCLAAGAVTSMAMTKFSLSDEERPPYNADEQTAPAAEAVSPDIAAPTRTRSGDPFDDLAPRKAERDFERSRAALLKRKEELSRLRDDFGPEHPAVQKVEDELAHLDADEFELRFAPAEGREIPPADQATMRLRTRRRTVLEQFAEPVSREELAAAKTLQTAIQSLKKSSNPEIQKKATETIQQQLSEQFDLDLKEREKELAEVEAKVKSLREQLDKRKAAREDIISLRLKTITNDAAGLGFPSGAGANEAADFPSVDVAESLNEVRVYAPPNGPVYTVPRGYPVPGSYPVPAISPPVALPVSPGLPAATPEPLPANPISPTY